MRKTKKSNRNKGSIMKAVCGILLALLMVTGMVLFRYFATERQEKVDKEMVQTPESTSNLVPEEPETEPVTEMEPITETEQITETEPGTQVAVTPTIEITNDKGYTSETYDLVSDMIYAYRYQPDGYAEAIQNDITRLKEADAELGKAWEGIMNYWDYVNTGLEINSGVLPDGLPEDNSLCIVVLGFQLLDDGSMAPELIGRCETALACAEKYPNAYIAVTGGVTSERNKTVSEGRVMADWLIEQGVSENRIIVEEESETSAQNAKFTGKILMEEYPQIKSVAIVSSDYHIPLGSLLFEENALLTEWQTGTKPFSVVSNAAYATPGREDYRGTNLQAQYLWNLAAPEY